MPLQKVCEASSILHLRQHGDVALCRMGQSEELSEINVATTRLLGN